jgi:hypothetical protein
VKEKREAGGTGGAPGREGEGIEITLRGIWVPAATLSKLRRTITALLAGALVGSGATLGALRAETSPPDPSPPAATDTADGDRTAADSPRVCGSAQCACPD